MRFRPLVLALALAAASTAASARAASVCSTSCTYQAPAGSGALLVFSGHGWGHGVGMSQYGAWGFALHGYSAQQILEHYFPGTTIGTTTTNTVRVLLADGKKSLKISCTVPFTVTDGDGAAHTLAAGTVSVGPSLRIGGQPLPAPLTFAAGAGGWLALGRPYRGQIQVDVVDGKLRAIDVVDLEQYLYGVVPAEMPSTWAAPALQAQAIASRSYALATRRVAAPFDLYADTRSQMYLGVSAETPATTAAVDATRGQVVTYGGKVASTFYFSSSGGETESIADAWGVTALPYLTAVADPYDVLSPYHDWGPLPISARTFGKALKVSGTILDLQTMLNGSGRVSRVSLVMQRSLASGDTQPSFGAAAVEAALGLRSTWFSVSVMSLQQPAPVAPVSYGSTVTLTGLVRGVTGVSLEERPYGGSWSTVGPVTPAADGSLQLPETPGTTTDYRLATPSAAVGYVRVRVAPVVQLAAPTPGQVAGSAQPVLPGAPVAVQVENPDQTWTTIATGAVDADGTFSLPATVPAGATYQVVVGPALGYAPGTSTPQIASGT
jgi:stage II sporulation protein D